jgi:hypothetical protein
MALNVEVGTGASNSESYASVANADLYWSNRGCAPWATLTTAQKEEALRRATDYIEQAYGQNFTGYRVTSTQALSFPRTDVELNGFYINSDVIPQILINATCEAAYKAAQGTLTPDVTQTVIREKIDVLEVEYDKNSPQYKQFRVITNILMPLLGGQGGVFHKVVRA